MDHVVDAMITVFHVLLVTPVISAILISSITMEHVKINVLIILKYMEITVCSKFLRTI